jgi:enoyl-[acyl-carrier protein] reductase I
MSNEQFPTRKEADASANRFSLVGKKGLVIGIANAQSIACGCARATRQQGAELALTYLNEKARHHVQPIAQELAAPVFMPCNVDDEQQVDELFDAIHDKWRRLDFLVHSIAFAPLSDLHGRLIDSTRAGFLQAMDISCHSLMRLSQKAEPLMNAGGSIITMSYLGAERVVPDYNLMGPVKAALECSVRYLASELSEKGIRVNTVSPGPIMTRAASGLANFDQLLQRSTRGAPLSRDLNIDDVGSLVAFLVSDAACSISGELFHVDGGYHALD